MISNSPFRHWRVSSVLALAAFTLMACAIVGAALYLDRAWTAAHATTKDSATVDMVETGSIPEQDAIGRAIEKFDR